MEYKCATCMYYNSSFSAGGYTGTTCTRLSNGLGTGNGGNVYTLCPGPATHVRVYPEFLCKLWKEKE